MSFCLTSHKKTFTIHIKITFPIGSPRKTENWYSRPCKKVEICKTHRLELMPCARTTLSDLLRVRVSMCMHLCDLNLDKEVTVQDECSQVMFVTDSFKALITGSVEWRGLINIYRFRLLSL